MVQGELRAVGTKVRVGRIWRRDPEKRESDYRFESKADTNSGA
jgi:hypothetical protein